MIHLHVYKAEGTVGDEGQLFPMGHQVAQDSNIYFTFGMYFSRSPLNLLVYEVMSCVAS